MWVPVIVILVVFGIHILKKRLIVMYNKSMRELDAVVAEKTRQDLLSGK